MRQRPSCGRRARAAAFLLAALVLPAGSPPRAEPADVAVRRAAERKNFTDAQIVEGFLKIAIGAEFSTGGRTDRIRKYDGPVRIFVENRAKPDRRRQVAEVIADIRSRVRHLDIKTVDSRARANVVVTLVRDRDVLRTIREIYGEARAQRIQHSLVPQCLSGFSKDAHDRIQRSRVIIAVDIGTEAFYHCIYEELLQALGPINDDASVPWTMFNDTAQMGFFGIYDQYLLNILYDPRVRPGMTRNEVKAVLPQVLADVRRWVAARNGLR